ncbi:MAG: hypothetical protein ACXQS8_06895 [Candidatus Helarchaeales archaeon]
METIQMREVFIGPRIVSGKYILEKTPHGHSDLVFWQKIASKAEVDSKIAKRTVNPSLGLHRLVNTKVLWRHNHPLKCDPDKGMCTVIGYVDDVKVMDEDVYARIRIEGWDREGRLAQHMIVDPKSYGFDSVGFSIHTWSWRKEGDEEPFRLHWEEVSLTPWPHCSTCTSEKEENVATIIKKGVFEMPEDKKENVEMSGDDVKIYLDTIRGMEKTVKELTDDYNNLMEKVKERDETIKKMEETIEKQKAKIDFLENKKPLIEKIAENEEEVEKLKDFTVEQLEFLVKKMEIKKTLKEDDDAKKVVVEPIEKTAENERRKNLLDKLKEISENTYTLLKREAEKKGKKLEDLVKGD